jgi:endonuclease G
MARHAVASAVALLLLAGIVHASVGFSNCTGSFINGYIPTAPSGAVQICREGAIAINYDVEMVDPAYSAYYVTPAELENHISGRDEFYLDPDLVALGVKQAHPDSDVWSVDWNRGHLCPNNIMSYSLSTKKATFTMANVAPQAAYFNQHPWEQLEEHTMAWVKANNALHIVTGIAYKNRANATRGKDNVAVPDYYWKVMCDVKEGRSVGFYGANVLTDKVAPTMVTVAAVESLYGGQLFPSSTCNTDSVNPAYWWSEGLQARFKDIARRR